MMVKVGLVVEAVGGVRDFDFFNLSFSREPVKVAIDGSHADAGKIGPDGAVDFLGRRVIGEPTGFFENYRFLDCFAFVFHSNHSLLVIVTNII